MNLALLDEQEGRLRHRFSNGSYAWQLQDLIDKNINPNYSFGIFCKIAVANNVLHTRWCSVKFLEKTISISRSACHILDLESVHCWGWRYSDGYIDSIKKNSRRSQMVSK